MLLTDIVTHFAADITRMVFNYIILAHFVHM